jgi:hypothetical protein
MGRAATRWIIGRYHVDQQKCAARPQHPRELAQRGGRARVVVRAVARRDDVERGVGKGKLLDIAELEGDVAQAALGREAPALLEHRLGQIDADNFGDQRREGQGGVAGATAGVKHALSAARRGGRQQRVEIRPTAMYGAGGVVRGHRAKLALNRLFDVYFAHVQ